MINNREVSRIINGMNIRERSDGRLEGRITINGKNKSFYGKNKADIKNKVKEYITKIENGYVDTNIIFKDFMRQWLDLHYKTIDEQTIMGYEKSYKRYFLNSNISDMKLGDITSNDIQKLLDSWALGGRNLAASTIKYLKSTLTMCFDYACKNKLISVNPMCDIVQPKTKASAEKEILTEEELVRFKDFCLKKPKGSQAKYKYKYKHGLIFLVILNLGLRVGELLALKWSDIHFQERYVLIRATAHIETHNEDWEKVGDCRHKIKNDTKTPSGRRKLYLNNEVISYLQEIKNLQEAENIDTDMVCTCSYRMLAFELKRIVANAGIDKKITLHCLRHTFGSILLQKGISIEVVSKLMGHSDIYTTYKSYIHILEEQKTKALLETVVC